MSAVIDQLIDKCLTDHRHYVDGRGNITETVFDRHKFAELLVRECMVVVEESEGCFQYFPHVLDNIEKHFGLTK